MSTKKGQKNLAWSIISTRETVTVTVRRQPNLLNDGRRNCTRNVIQSQHHGLECVGFFPFCSPSLIVSMLRAAGFSSSTNGFWMIDTSHRSFPKLLERINSMTDLKLPNQFSSLSLSLLLLLGVGGTPSRVGMKE